MDPNNINSINEIDNGGNEPAPGPLNADVNPENPDYSPTFSIFRDIFARRRIITSANQFMGVIDYLLLRQITTALPFDVEMLPVEDIPGQAAPRFLVWEDLPAEPGTPLPVVLLDILPLDEPPSDGNTGLPTTPSLANRGSLRVGYHWIKYGLAVMLESKVEVGPENNGSPRFSVGPRVEVSLGDLIRRRTHRDGFGYHGSIHTSTWNDPTMIGAKVSTEVGKTNGEAYVRLNVDMLVPKVPTSRITSSGFRYSTGLTVGCEYEHYPFRDTNGQFSLTGGSIDLVGDAFLRERLVLTRGGGENLKSILQRNQELELMLQHEKEKLLATNQQNEALDGVDEAINEVNEAINEVDEAINEVAPIESLGDTLVTSTFWGSVLYLANEGIPLVIVSSFVVGMGVVGSGSFYSKILRHHLKTTHPLSKSLTLVLLRAVGPLFPAAALLLAVDRALFYASKGRIHIRAAMQPMLIMGEGLFFNLPNRPIFVRLGQGLSTMMQGVTLVTLGFAAYKAQRQSILQLAGFVLVFLVTIWISRDLRRWVLIDPPASSMKKGPSQ